MERLQALRSILCENDGFIDVDEFLSHLSAPDTRLILLAQEVDIKKRRGYLDKVHGAFDLLFLQNPVSTCEKLVNVLKRMEMHYVLQLWMAGLDRRWVPLQIIDRATLTGRGPAGTGGDRQGPAGTQSHRRNRAGADEDSLRPWAWIILIARSGLMILRERECGA
ncbi:unnamed protein product [Darwinula stevensoni]|uniref:Uncharacterized protein n=1 Tax=Darwinula stevensoni TaxID=69355 RepID=A0A7R9A799_9CRUS|nr:unnamed protein product [Darwinula stevensoni]CAG0892319.1 unnamed protein product [Darwinula stevensoni]